MIVHFWYLLNDIKKYDITVACFLNNHKNFQLKFEFFVLLKSKSDIYTVLRCVLVRMTLTIFIE